MANKKQTSKMCVLGLTGFPKTNTTTTSPWPSPSRDNKLAVKPEREEKHGVITLTTTAITHGFDSTGGFITGQTGIELWTQKKLCINHVGWKNKQSKSDGRFVWNSSFLRQREFPQVGLSLRSSVVLYGATLSKNTCRIIVQENPNNCCFPYLGLSTFNCDLIRKMIWK